MTGKLCKFTESVFGGKYPRSYFKGTRHITGKVIAEKVSSKGQKSLQIQVVECCGHEPIEPGKRIVRSFKSLIRTIKFFD